MPATLQRMNIRKRLYWICSQSTISPVTVSPDAIYCRLYHSTLLIFDPISECNFSIVVAGVTATLIHDAISNPTEVIKQRLQMYNAPYRTVFGCAMGVYRAEGVRAFYRSYVTQLCMNIPHQTIHFSTYEFFQNKVNQRMPIVQFASANVNRCNSDINFYCSLLFSSIVEQR